MLRGLAAGLAHETTGMCVTAHSLAWCRANPTAQLTLLCPPCCCLSPQLADHERHPKSAADLPELLQLLGLPPAGPRQLLTDIAKTTALTLVLFSGPLYHSAMRHLQQTKEAAGAAWQEAGKTPLLHQVRDLVVSPVAEEWCFRACMLPLLWMQVGR